MPLKAKIDGRDIVSVLCSDDDWAEAQRASKGNIQRLQMTCCGAPAYASHSPLDLRYFAHKPGHERCASAGESDEHECLKAVAAKAVQALAGWKADVEVSGEGWRADVLAVRGSYKVAIEIQLSSQAKRATGERNDRFEASEVTAFWLTGEKNHFNDFGDGLQAPVVGRTIREQMVSTHQAVTDLLSAIERQSEMANALARLIRNIPDWTYEIERQGTVPACFELRRNGVRQQILLGELGPSLLPTVFRPVDGKQIGADQFAGAILQLRMEAPHLRGYQSSSFQLNHRDINGSLDRALLPILQGRKRWQGKEHTEIVPGSFVHYEEECAACGASFLRITHLMIGNPRHPRSMAPRIVRNDWDQYELVLSRAEALAQRKGLRLGPLAGEVRTGFTSAVPVAQRCPQCRVSAPAPLISDDEALRFSPDREEQFRFRLSSPGKGWGDLTSWVERPIGDVGAWENLLAQKRQERRHDREEGRRQEELGEAERRRSLEEYRRLAEVRRLQRIAEEEARKAEDFRRAAEANRRAEEERQARIESAQAGRRDKLTNAATYIIFDNDSRNLWLRSSNKNLKLSADMVATRPIELAAESQEGLNEALRLLRSTKF